jgi:acylphosphatase
MIRRQTIFRGTVQGVGFRWTTRRLAAQYRVTGYVRNCPDGSVELLTEGDPAEVEAFCQAVRQRMSDYVLRADSTDAPATGEFLNFDVRH